jgi:hypothetical protein
MTYWKKVVCEGMVSGSFASILTTAVMACLGKHRHNSAYGPTNAVSHALWGDSAFWKNTPSLRYTGLGYGLHHLSSVFWATLYSAVYGHRNEAKRPVNAIIGSGTTAAVACFIDYKLTPKRLTPGFEHRLSKPEMTCVYAALGLGIAMACVAMSSIPRDRHLK